MHATLLVVIIIMKRHDFQNQMLIIIVFQRTRPYETFGLHDVVSAIHGKRIKAKYPVYVHFRDEDYE